MMEFEFLDADSRIASHFSGMGVLQEVEAIPVLISALGNDILNLEALVPSVPQTSSG